MKKQQVEELVLQSLEHELGGVKVYTAALGCAAHEDLHEEWEKYLEETRTHVATLEECVTPWGSIPAKRRRGGTS